MNLDIKSNLDKGLSYPSAFYKSIDTELDSNDILGVSYIKEIFKNNYNITPICIKRTNNYLSNERNSEIVSASAIRNALKDNVDVCKYVPTDVIPYLNNIHTIDDYFDLIKYKIISCDYLSDIQTVDEGIENRLKKFIYSSNNIDELVNKVKTKRYTYNKIRRMLIHILVDFKKTDAFNKVTYIRVLGFNKKGMSYLNGIKKNIDLPIITNCNNEYAKLELKVTSIYDSSLVKYEYNKKPIIKGD